MQTPREETNTRKIRIQLIVGENIVLVVSFLLQHFKCSEKNVEEVCKITKNSGNIEIREILYAPHLHLIHNTTIRTALTLETHTTLNRKTPQLRFDRR